MRRKRVKNDGEGYYHLVSRCAFKQFLFQDSDKEVFVGMMRRMAAFSGIDILTYCVMSNHFHILVHVPPPRQLDVDELLARVAILYGTEYAAETRLRWEAFRKTRQLDRLEKEQSLLRKRMFDISPFMKSLNQRFSIWYGAHHPDFEGTIWQGRFSSTLVEGNGSLAAVAAYIDLNPVRAGIVTDPKNYAFSGYGAATAGDADARKGLSGVYGQTRRSATAVMAAYRGLLYAKGASDLPAEAVQGVLAERPPLPLPLLLRHKIRAMTQGLALGSADFTASIFARHRYAFSETRRQPPRTAPLSPQWSDISLCAVRPHRSAAATRLA
jgi:REP element-mobilizing transposase RayT